MSRKESWNIVHVALQDEPSTEKPGNRVWKIYHHICVPISHRGESRQGTRCARRYVARPHVRSTRRSKATKTVKQPKHNLLEGAQGRKRSRSGGSVSETPYLRPATDHNGKAHGIRIEKVCERRHEQTWPRCCNEHRSISGSRVSPYYARVLRRISRCTSTRHHHASSTILWSAFSATNDTSQAGLNLSCIVVSCSMVSVARGLSTQHADDCLPARRFDATS